MSDATPLKLFNTMGRQAEDFAVPAGQRVGMYSCGPTVYAYPHIGNMRAYVFSDTLRRVLRVEGLRRPQVMNITDVGHLISDADEGEDKLEVGGRARERRSSGRSPSTTPSVLRRTWPR